MNGLRVVGSNVTHLRISDADERLIDTRARRERIHRRRVAEAIERQHRTARASLPDEPWRPAA